MFVSFSENLSNPHNYLFLVYLQVSKSSKRSLLSLNIHVTFTLLVITKDFFMFIYVFLNKFYFWSLPSQGQRSYRITKSGNVSLSLHYCQYIFKMSKLLSLYREVRTQAHFSIVKVDQKKKYFPHFLKYFDS